MIWKNQNNYLLMELLACQFNYQRMQVHRTFSGSLLLTSSSKSLIVFISYSFEKCLILICFQPYFSISGGGWRDISSNSCQYSFFQPSKVHLIILYSYLRSSYKLTTNRSKILEYHFVQLCGITKNLKELFIQNETQDMFIMNLLLFLHYS